MPENNRIILNPADASREMGEALMLFINRLMAIYPRLESQIKGGFAVVVVTSDGKQIVIQGNHVNPDQIFKHVQGAGMPNIPPLIKPGG